MRKRIGKLNLLRRAAPAFVAVTITSLALAIVSYIEAQSSPPRLQTPSQPANASITGLVQDDRNTPVSNVTVTISSEGFSAVTLTNAEGRFEFKSLKPARYLITAETARFRKQSVTLTITKPEELLTTTIRLTFSSLHVTAFDANNRPLNGVNLTVTPSEQSSTGTSSTGATTDEGGHAYFGRLSQGSYHLTAALPGYDDYHSEVFISSGITTEFPIRLLPAPIIPINEKTVERYGVPRLPSKNVRALYQDRDGWLWFGTDRGLARFNGADFKSSATTGSPYESLNGQEVRALAEDAKGLMWAATANGLRAFTKTGEIVKTKIDGLLARHLTADGRGALWAATENGLIKYQEGTLKTFTEEHGLPTNDVRLSVEDQNGNLWVATAGGVARIEGERVTPLTQLLPLAGGQGQTANPTSLEGLTNVQSLFVDRSGQVWFASAQGLAVYDGHQIQRPQLGDAIPAKASLAEVPVRAIAQDRSGRMCFALNAGGVLLYDLATGNFQRLASLEQDKVAAMLTGREGEAWFATAEGAVELDLYSFVRFTSSRGLVSNDVRAIASAPTSFTGEGKPSSLWFLTATGVSKVEGERFTELEGFRANASVRAVAFDQTGNAWFATDRGLVRLSGQTLTQYNESNGLASNNVRWAEAIANGSQIVFATARGVNLYKDAGLTTLDALAGFDVRHVYEDASQVLWFATASGVVKYDLQSGEREIMDTSRGLIDNDVRRLTRYQNSLLVATRAGVQAIANLPRLPASPTILDTDPANALFVDRDGCLWIGNDDGQVKKIRVFGKHILSSIYSGEEYGLSGSRINAIFEDGLGNLWIATNKGVVRHLPARLTPAVQGALKVGDRLLYAPTTGHLEIPYGERRLQFDFTSASMLGQTRYLYRVNSESASSEWQLLQTQQSAGREVELFDLTEGEHSFEVIALNRDLYGINAPALSLPFRIGAPFWRQGWFWALMVLAAGVAVAASFAGRARRNVGYVLPKELRTYVPIEPNPYIVGNPIRAEKMFYGREDDFRYVRTKLEGASQGVLIVFCGERRVGKSSILYQLLNRRLGDRFVPVFIDMQEMVIASDAEFFARVARQVITAIAKFCTVPRADSEAVNATAPVGSSPSATVGTLALQMMPPTLQVPQFDGQNPYPLFSDFLDDVLRAIGDRVLLMLVDEYELLEGKVDEGKLSPEFFTFLAGVMDSKERLAFIFTGSRRLEERDRKYWRELLRRSLFRKVGFLTERDTLRLITEPVRNRVVYGRGVINRIHRLTSGQPFYTQVICQNIVDYLNEQEQNWVTPEDLKAVIADVIDHPLPQMIYTWDGLSDDEKLALSLLAETLSDENHFATSYELRTAADLNQYPVNLSENTIRLTLEEMFRRELLDKNATDGFRFKIDLLRLWIKRSHSIWQVVKEVRTL